MQAARHLVEVALGIGLHEELVKLIGDAAAVLDGGHHVAHGLPGGAGCALRVHLQQVVLQRARTPAGTTQSHHGRWCCQQLLVEVQWHASTCQRLKKCMQHRQAAMQSIVEPSLTQARGHTVTQSRTCLHM